MALFRKTLTPDHEFYIHSNWEILKNDEHMDRVNTATHSTHPSLGQRLDQESYSSYNRQRKTYQNNYNEQLWASEQYFWLGGGAGVYRLTL